MSIFNILTLVGFAFFGLAALLWFVSGLDDTLDDGELASKAQLWSAILTVVGMFIAGSGPFLVMFGVL